MPGGGGNSTTTQKADPWAGQQPYLTDMFKAAQDRYYSAGPSYYGSAPMPTAPRREDFTKASTAQAAPGFLGGQSNTGAGVPPPATSGIFNRARQPATTFDQAGYDAAMAQYNTAMTTHQNAPTQSTVSGFTPDTIQAQNLARSVVGNQQGIADLGAQGLQYQIGQAIDPNSNPYFQNAVQGAIRPMVQQFTDPGGPLASIRSGMMASGQYGSSRQGIAEGVATGRLGQSILDTTAAMGSAAYGQGLDAQARGLALLPGVQAAQTTPATTLDAVGQQNQGMNQAFLNDAVARWNWDQQLPDAKLAQYQNLIQGTFGGSMTATAEGAKGNPLMGAVGGAASGYALATMMPALGMTGPVGAGLGLMFGLMMS